MSGQPVQALAAQARAFSTQTEIAVVSGLPPLDVGRKVSKRGGCVWSPDRCLLQI